MAAITICLTLFPHLFPHFTNGKAESQVVQNCEVSEILPYLHGNKLVRHYFVELYRRRQWHPTPVLLPGKSHGRRSLVGCRPWDREESDRTERLHFHFSLSCIGEGNGNLLQCSCLENPRDGGAWWAAVYAVKQSRTQLKRLSIEDKELYYSWFSEEQEPYACFGPPSSGTSLVAQVINQPAMQETRGWCWW